MSEFDFSDAVNPFASNKATQDFDFTDAVNPFDSGPDRSLWDATKDTAQDLAVSLAKAPITAVEGVAGLVDIPTGGRFSKALENEGGAVGFRPRQAKEILDQLHTDSFREKQQEFQNADGILDKTVVALQNPSLVTNTVAESSASMLMGGAGGRLLKTAFPKVSGATAGAVGEGAMMAGAQAAEIRSETEDGLLTAGQSAAAAGTGVLGGLFGYFGGQLANKLGIGDVDTLLAQGLTAGDLAEEIARTPAKSVPRRVIEGAITEGFLEELPQSVSETIIKNLALDKQWNEGLDDAIVMGTLAGMAVGGPVGAVRQTGAPQAEPLNELPADASPQPATSSVAAPSMPEQGDPVIWSTPDGETNAVFAGMEELGGQQLARVSIEGVDSYVPMDQLRWGVTRKAGSSSTSPTPDEDIATMEREVEEGDPNIDVELETLLGDGSPAQLKGTEFPAATENPAGQLDGIDYSPVDKGELVAGLSLQPLEDNSASGAYEGGIDFDNGKPSVLDTKAQAVMDRANEHLGLQENLAATQAYANETAEPVRIDAPDIADLSDRYTPDASANVRPSPAEPRLNIQAADSRLARPEYRSQLSRMATELIKGGGVSYVRDSNDRIVKRTPSLNADWFKSLNENSETSMSVEDTQAAIKRALAGEKLGVRQLRVVGAALDTIGEERGSYARELRAMRENARQDRRQAYEQWLEATNVPANAEFESVAWPENPGEQFLETDYLVEQSIEDRATSELVSVADSLGVEWGAIDNALSAGDINAQTKALTQLIWDSRNEHRQSTKLADQPAVSPASAQGRPTTSQRADPALETEPTNVAQSTAEIVDATAAAEAATAPENTLPEPTTAQKEAGNYKKAHVKIQGLDISIENARGSTRSGTDNDGNAWSVTMHNHYGYLKRTEGADGDHVDVFIGPNPDSNKVFIVDQVNEDGTFDEHKVLLGFDSKLKARSGYKSNYSNGWKVGPITSMSMEEFKAWIKDGDTTKPMKAENLPASGKMISNEPRPSAGVSVSEVAAVKDPLTVGNHEPAQPIEDFGQKLGGARKDAWGGFRDAISGDVNTATLPLSQSFPEPDYVKLAAEGMPMDSLALIAAIRHEIPNKPRVAYKVKLWASQVDSLRGFAANLIGGNMSVEQVRAQMEKAGSSLRPLADALPAISKANAESLKLAAKYRIHSAAYTLFNGQKYSPAKVFYTPSHGKTRIYDLASDNKQEVQEALTQLIAREANANRDSVGKKQSNIAIYQDRQTRQVFLGWKGGSGVLRIQNFGSTAEARKYLAENRDDVEAKLQRIKATPSERRAENRTRTGIERFSGNVTPAVFADTFGLRGVEFGNWVEQGRRQKDLNEAYDALMDLADVLGIPPKALALNGELGLAFGARGKGGKNSASAHYEPGSIVMNLTKNKGAGSLAHEWFHAVDNYFGRVANMQDAYATEGSRIRGGDMRPEVRAAFDGVMKAISQSGLIKRAKVLDQRRSKPYWSTEVELAARAFESFIIAELESKGFSNDYLANIVEQEAWEAAEAMGLDDAGTYPYPTKDEQGAINQAFRILFDTLQIKETDSGTALFSIKDPTISSRNAVDTDGKLKIGEVSGGATVSKMEADAVVKRILAGIQRSGGAGLKRLNGIEVVSNVSELPAAIQNAVKKQSNDGNRIEGVFHNNSIYINRSALNTPADVERVVLHELYGHFGIRQLFDTVTNQAMGGLYLSVGGAKGVKEMAARHGIDLARYESGYQRLVEEGTITSETMRSVMMEELLAHIAQDNRPTVKRKLKELLGQLRSWLREKGFLRLSKMNDSDILYLLKQARDAVDHGNNIVADGTLIAIAQPLFSLTKDMPRPTRKIIGSDPVLAAWTALAMHDSTFQLPISNEKTLEGIFEAGGEAYKALKVFRADELGAQLKRNRTRHAWRIVTEEGARAAVYQSGKSVWIDVSDLNSGEDGKRIYNAVANYAFNTGRVFIGDPAGLSDIALTRRLENMISSALKFGTTAHLWPHQRQIDGSKIMGIPGLHWEDGADASNLRQMIDVSYLATVKQFPEIQDLRYNPENDAFEDSVDGSEFTETDFRHLAESKRGESGSDALQQRSGKSGGFRGPITAGRTSLERAVFTHTISRGTREERLQILANISQLGSERLSKILYSLSSRVASPEPRPSAGVSASEESNSDTASKADPSDNFQVPRTGATPFQKSIDTALRKVVDKMKPLLNTQKEIEKYTGSKIDENLDAYLAEEAFHGKTENDLRKLQETYVEPLAEYMAKNNITREELDLFLWAAHASERNKQIAKINPKMPDGGSGMTTAKSLEVLKKAQAEGKLETLKGAAKFVYGALKHRRDLMKGVLLEDGAIDSWDENYKFYVPLKGQAQNEGGGNTPKIGRGFDIRGKESFRALGRSTMPESPVLHAIKDTTETIVRYRKNEVGNVLLDLIQAQPNDDYWQVFDASHPEFERRLMKAEGKDQVGTARVIDKSRYFITKKNGKEYYIKLQDEQLLTAMKNLGAEPLAGPLRAMAKVTRYLSSINTSLNPEFVISNFVRDIQSAIYNAAAEQDLHDGKIKGEQIVGKMVKDVPIAIRAIKASLSGKQLDGKAGEWQKVFDQFRDGGAKTGWYDMKDLDGQAKDLERLISLSQTGVRSNVYKAGRATMTFIDNINTAIENGVRLAVYKNAVDAGVSQKQATSLAKNLTVNFNRKGEWGAVMNSLWMFTNAAIQGNKVFYRAMATMKLNPDGTKSLNKAQKAAVVMAGLAIGLAMLNRSMAGDDDDGESLYDKVPDHIKEKNIILMKSVLGGEPGEYWSLPLPYGYNIFHVVGTEIEAAFNKPKNAGKSAMNILKAGVGSFLPISLAENEDSPPSLMRTLAPSMVKPFADLDANTNFFGGDIFRENRLGVPKPDSQLARRNTPEIWKWITEFLNEATGGSDHRRGMIDINPDKLDYIFKYYTGGVGAFAARTQDAVIKKAQGIELEDRQIPFLRRLSGKVTHYPDQNRFYNRRNEIGQLEKEWKSLKGRERMDFYKEHGEQIRLKALAKTTDSQLKRLRTRRDAVDENKSLTAQEKDLKLKEIERQTKMHIDRFNKRWPE